MTVRAAQAMGGDHWRTPPDLLDVVRRVAPIGLDPCSQPDNPTRASIWAVAPGAWPYDAALPSSARIDGFSFPWSMHCPKGSLAFVNYPYSSPDPWLSRCRREADLGLEVIGLGQVDTSTNWWHAHCAPPQAQAVCFLRGRLTFVGAPGPARFASFLAYWGTRPARFAAAFSRVGAIWR